MLTRRHFLAATAASAAVPVAVAQTARPRLRRADCFFGLHFDLHPSARDTALGRDVTEAMVGKLLERVAPDYVQYDCKGHAGYLGFVSKVGTSSPGIVADSLAVWRKMTAQRGVGLFIHFSGVWDSLAVKQHPEWARVRPDGKPEERQTSLWGPYVDQLMIPQLKEAVGTYDLDGAWVDGECWAINPDYCEAARREFQEATGIAKLPQSKDDPGWLAFLELNRKRFRHYVKHYVDALHEFRPAVQVASNWLYTTYVPEKPELPVDFVSGDYLGNASISTARLEARYLSHAGKPWDLMAWGFTTSRSNPGGHILKPAVQLEQEAAVVLAQGGGFQVYYQPTRAGHLSDSTVGVMERLAKFCRARQALSHKSETVPQIGVLLSTYALYNSTDKLFGGWGGWVNPARGLVDALVENHYSVDVLPEWRLEELAARYPVIVAPDWRDIGPAARDLLLAYVRAGGKLIAVGAETCALFGDHLGVRLEGKAAAQPALIPGGEVFANIGGDWQTVSPLPGTRVLLERFPAEDERRDGKCAATVASLGKGSIAAIYGPLGSVFAATHAAAIRSALRRVVEAVFQPALRVEAPPTVEVALRRKGGRTLIHLLNATAMQVAGDYVAGDYIPAAGPVQLSIELPARPATVRLQPGARVLNGSWSGGRWSGTVEAVPIHTIVEI